VVLTIIDLAYTLHSHFSWKRPRGGPTVMPAGQLLGWTTSACLLVILAIACVGVYRSLKGAHDQFRSVSPTRRQQPRSGH